MLKATKNQFIVQSIALSVSVLILSVGCSTGSSNPPTDDAAERLRVPLPKTLPEPLAETMTDSIQAISAAPAPSAAQSIGRNSSQSNYKARTASESAYDQSLPSKSQTYINDPFITQQKNTENYQEITTNSVIQVADQSTSTFSIDVDTGAYSNVRRMLNAGQLPPADAVRVEELLNYFSYNYPSPTSVNTPFSIHTELGNSPWNDNTRLLHIGLKGYQVADNDRPSANLVFLIDVSGSMADANKLGLLKSSINMLTRELNADDRVSIVVYAGASGVVLEPTPGNEHQTISRALSQLSAGGSTNGEAGIELAYSMATKGLSEGSINRIILATDGDFNVGIADIEMLKQLIERKRKTGIALTTLGFGSGNYNDYLMEQLADVGNGNYAYIDTLNEARKVLSEELTATLLTIAKDVKIQIEFNPAQVSEYRLLGYVNRHLKNEDFANDSVDAGEIGSGHTVTALYEIALVGEEGEWNTRKRYQSIDKSSDYTLGDEIAEVRLRYKQPAKQQSELITRIVKRSSLINELSDASEHFRFSAAVAGFAQLLRENKYLVNFDYADAAQLASSAKGTDRFGYRHEFVQMIKLANSLDPRSQATVQVPDNDRNTEG